MFSDEVFSGKVFSDEVFSVKVFSGKVFQPFLQIIPSMSFVGQLLLQRLMPITAAALQTQK